MIPKYFLPFCRLLLHTVLCFLCCAEGFYLDTFQPKTSLEVFFPLQFFENVWETLVSILCQQLGRNHQWSHQVLGFYLLGSFFCLFVFTDSIFLLIIDLFRFFLSSLFSFFITSVIGYMFLGTHPFLFSCSICWCVNVHCSLLWTFVFLWYWL